ncbi:MAG: TolC family protein [Aquabacterium sp.]
MIFNSLSRARCCAGLLAVCAATLPGWAQPNDATPSRPADNTATPTKLPQDTSFSVVLEQAWLRHPDAIAARNLSREARALADIGQSWVAGQAIAQVSQTEDLSAMSREQRGTELGVVLPIWQWGQRQQTQEQARAWEALAQAQVALTRWRLASEIHDQAVRVWLADAEVAQLSAQIQTMVELDRDVQRRVRAGDLAPADALASEAELLSLRTSLSAAQQALTAERASWQQWAGETPPPAPGTWPARSEPPGPSHPLLKWHQAKREWARIKLEATERRWGAPPELGVSVKQEGRGGTERSRSATLALSVPLGQSVHRQSEIASAMSESDLAEAEAHQAERQVHRARLEAESTLHAIQQQRQAEDQRVQLLQKRANWLQKSFNAGETALPELLRAHAAAAQAHAARVQKDIQLIAAQTRLHWAQGQQP